MTNGIATKSELLAAGYNSNPMRLPLYLKNGGTEWRTLIPAETKMYLAIYGSVDQAMERSAVANDDRRVDISSSAVPQPGLVTEFLSLISETVLRGKLLLR